MLRGPCVSPHPPCMSTSPLHLHVERPTRAKFSEPQTRAHNASTPTGHPLLLRPRGLGLRLLRRLDVPLHPAPAHVWEPTAGHRHALGAHGCSCRPTSSSVHQTCQFTAVSHAQLLRASCGGRALLGSRQVSRCWEMPPSPAGSPCSQSDAPTPRPSSRPSQQGHTVRPPVSWSPWTQTEPKEVSGAF